MKNIGINQKASYKPQVKKILDIYCIKPIGLANKRKADAIYDPLFQLDMSEDKLRQLMMEVAETHEIMSEWEERRRAAAIDALLQWRYRPQASLPELTIR